MIPAGGPRKTDRANRLRRTLVMIGVAHASRVLVAVSRRNNLFLVPRYGIRARFRKVRDGGTPSPTRETPIRLRSGQAAR